VSLAGKGGDAKTGGSTGRKNRPAKGDVAAGGEKAEASERRRRTGGRKAARLAMRDQVSQELLRLRPLLKEVGTAVLDRLDGEMAAMAQLFEGDPVAGERPALPSAAALKEMLGRIHSLKVKPKKGRVKDLARIESLMRGLSESMPPEV
jgi:hypothetical protein